MGEEWNGEEGDKGSETFLFSFNFAVSRIFFSFSLPFLHLTLTHSTLSLSLALALSNLRTSGLARRRPGHRGPARCGSLGRPAGLGERLVSSLFFRRFFFRGRKEVEEVFLIKERILFLVF